MSDEVKLKKLPVGTTNFAKIINENLLFVDKSLLIKELIESDEEVTLITRPRRWGKSLNLSMLQHFFADKVDDKSTKGLFDNLKIASEKLEDKTGTYVSKHKGQYPVIFISFKDVKGDNIAEALANIYGIIQSAYQDCEYLTQSKQLSSNEKKIIEAGMSGFKDENDSDRKDKFINGIKNLSRLLKKHHGKACYILIDEYDTPLNTAHLKGYLANLTQFYACFPWCFIKR